MIKGACQGFRFRLAARCWLLVSRLWFLVGELFRVSRFSFAVRCFGAARASRRGACGFGIRFVVPAQSRAQFEPVLKGANLFGRGASDMKSGPRLWPRAALEIP